MMYTDDEVRGMPLGRGRDELFDQLTSTPYAARPPRHQRALRVALGSVAAAAVVAVGVSVVSHGEGGTSPLAQPSAQAGTAGAGVVGAAEGTRSFPVALVGKAKRTPRLLVDRPGWTVTSIEGLGAGDGKLSMSGPDGSVGDVSVMWLPKKDYPFKDRVNSWRVPFEGGGTPYEAGTTVLGEKVRYFALSDQAFVTTLKRGGDSIIEIRAHGFDRAGFLELLGNVKAVSPEAFLAQMPADVVKPKGAESAAQELLATMPLPSGFVYEPTDEILDRYQFGAYVTGQVLCAWVDHFGSGKPGAKEEAGAALMTSRTWPILREMDAAGGWSSSFWEYAEIVNSGKLVGRTMDQGSFGCEGGE